jgi:hypothetical protein
MIPRITLRKALSDAKLLGRVLEGPSWDAWKVLLLAAMGEALTDSERAIFTQLTKRAHEPLRRVEEFVGVIGRRGGKSRAVSVLTTYIAGLCKHPALVPGERGIVLIIAPDQKQADITLDYIEANFRASPILVQLIDDRIQRALRLNNHIDIEVRASDFRRLRGSTYCCVVADESAFWQTENSSNPDTEILSAIRPGLATTGGPLFMISSPYARRGELWTTYNKHFGPAGDPLILVARGTSRELNPSLPQAVVDRAMERDPAAAAAEYGAEFRTDIEGYVAREMIEACVMPGVHEQLPQADCAYHAFVDPSGGSADSFALAIGHRDFGRESVVVDCLREVRPPFSPEVVCGEFAQLLTSYHIASVVGDKYAGIWPVEQFARFDILYEQSAAPKSELYVSALPLINSRRLELLDNRRLIDQIASLERRTARSGRDSIDHAHGGHDDLANVVAGLAAIIHGRYSGYSLYTNAFSTDDDDRNDQEAANERYRQGLAAHIWNTCGHWPT